jgi:histidyl-tRNA synthetase
MLPDADVIKIAIDVLTELEIGNFKVKLNHRKLLDAIMSVCGVPDEKFRPICSAIDKLDKESWDAVKKEMTDIKGLAEASADQLALYVVNRSGYGPSLLKELEADSKLSEHPLAKEAFQDLNLLFQYLEAYNVIDKVSFDLSLARGLDYYTGLIYEVVLTDSDRFGSIAAGGRYDNLVGMFSSKTVPAVGVSIGIERILTILEEQHAQKSASGKIKKTQTQVLVASIGKDMLIHRMRLVDELWAAGFAAEFLYNANPKPDKQLDYANNQQIPIILWIGEDEMKANVVGLKRLSVREQTRIPRSEVISAVKKVLAEEQSIPATLQQPITPNNATTIEQQLSNTTLEDGAEKQNS